MNASSRRPHREFGAWLRSRRLARRWTQEELARRLGYDVSYVRKIEWGERRPSDALQVRLAEVLGVPLSGLPSAVPRTPRPLPEAASPLVDRIVELRAVIDLLDHHSRLVTLVGGPGIGKTRLAVALASHYDALLPGGSIFVPLVDVIDGTTMAQTIAEVLGMAGPEGAPPLGRHPDVVPMQETLLVLDNFEHLIDDADLVARLLLQVPTLRVLVTSRQALELRAETQYAISPLAFPAQPSQPAERLGDVAAVALFVTRARKVRPDFTLDAANAADVAEICARVQGIPLAIEMAAGAVKFLSPKALLGQLGHGLDLPVAGPRDAPEHHRTLRAAVGWSFELLGPEQRTLFSRLAVFAGGCTLEGAEAVCRLPDEHVLDTRSGLLGLASKSLLEPVVDPVGRTRFTTLETVRAFALEQLTGAGEVERFQRRHAGWCLELAEINERRLTGAEQATALAVLDVEHANVRAAIRWSLEHEPPVALRLCAALWRFWWLRGYLTEGRRWLGEALANEGGEDRARAVALTGEGALARTQAAYEPAKQLLEQGGALARAIGDRPTLALALLNLGIVAEHQGLPVQATALFEEARQLYADLDDRRGVGHALNCLGTSRLGRGDLDGSTRLFEEALSIFRAIGDDWSAAMALANLGWVAQQQGRGPLARARYEKGLAMYRSLGDDRGVANMLLNLGLAVHASGGGEDVGGLFAEAMLGFARQGERRGVAECLEALADVRHAADPAPAAVLLGAAGALREAIGAPLPPGDRAAHDRLVRTLRAALGEVSFETEWQRGRLLDVEEVVALALADAEDSSVPGR